MMHLTQAICEEYMVPEPERVGGLARSTRNKKKQNNAYTHSPYSVGVKTYGNGYKERSPVKA